MTIVVDHVRQQTKPKIEQKRFKDLGQSRVCVKSCFANISPRKRELVTLVQLYSCFFMSLNVF